jgi:ectoine hydroxylase-related dioxygenase (phytanoyl-CoA dioxygenase family)
MLLHDLEIVGYTVVKNFLEPDDISVLTEDYNKNKKIDNVNYSASVASKEVENILFPKIKLLLNEINISTSIDVDLIVPIACYLNNKDCDFKWHQDHESFFVHQQHKNYLNFYIPFIKPDQNKSGLGVIPFDLLEFHCPDYATFIINNGATRFFPKDSITEVYEDESGKTYELPVNLDKLAEYPELNSGDLLLMRGDVIHKTQDILTDRCSVTVRCTNGNSVLNKHRLINGSQKKKTMIKNNQRMYDNILRAFGDKEEILTKEIYKDESCLIATKY